MERRIEVVGWHHRTMCGRLTVLVMGLVLPYGTALAQSFDCDKAATNVEHAICRDKSLGGLDVELAQQLKASLPAAADQRTALLREARRWVSYRDKHCSALDPGESFEGCLTQVYTARIAELKSRAVHPEPKSTS